MIIFAVRSEESKRRDQIHTYHTYGTYGKEDCAESVVVVVTFVTFGKPDTHRTFLRNKNEEEIFFWESEGGLLGIFGCSITTSRRRVCELGIFGGRREGEGFSHWFPSPL